MTKAKSGLALLTESSNLLGHMHLRIIPKHHYAELTKHHPVSTSKHYLPNFSNENTTDKSPPPLFESKKRTEHQKYINTLMSQPSIL